MHLDETTRHYLQLHPNDCSIKTFGPWQILWYLVVLEGCVYLLFRNWVVLLTGLNLVLTLIYFGCIVFRLIAVLKSLAHGAGQQVSAEEMAAVPESDWPMYTILVPLYKEANIANSIIRSIERLDYPKEKLDVKLLLEEDDIETAEAMNRLELGPYYDVIVVPKSDPRTKPKACNHGLQAARGELVVIFDAEDRPDPDQLRKAACAFRHVDDDVVCLQAKLNYYNPRQNLLTRWFAIEYTMWFDLFLPGLQRLDAPIPLGGTSNHFRTDVLKRIGGWDPFNVTEDCDLGIRLAKDGCRTVLLDSTTWEEANSRLGNWLRQRSRWVKGFLQTHLVHLRRPLGLCRALGLRRVFYFWCTVGGMSFMLVLNLVYWLIGLTYGLLLTADMFQGRNPWIVMAGDRGEYRHAWKLLFSGGGEDPMWSAISITFFSAGCVLFAANFLFVGINCLACQRRGYRDLIPYALISPLYWVLISIAAMKGLLQLFTNPFYWEKTRHGLTEAPPMIAEDQPHAEVSPT